ncbi:MAG: AraC family transcriptional regulator [Planctomycetota bacterium]
MAVPPERFGSCVLFEGATLRIGAVHCGPEHPDFRAPGPIERPVFVFPRASVWIRRPDQRPVVAGPNVVSLYNAGEEVQRRALTPRGDRHEWFQVDPSLRFSVPYAPSDPACYAVQRALTHYLRTEATPDPLLVEETALGLLDRLTDRARGVTPQGRDRRRSRPVERAEAYVSVHFRRRETLADLARVAGCSPFHLAHAFRLHRGSTLHQYRDRLRLCAALELVLDGPGDLTALALELGYSSHSHLTAAFRRRFGLPPSALRRAASRARVETLRAHLWGTRS